MKTFINIGVGVNSVAILAMIKLEELDYVNPIAVFADTGAEKKATYTYLKFLKTVSPLPIYTVKAKEGGLYDFCKERVILPQRFMRWCTDKWKKRPLTTFRKAMLKEGEAYLNVMGIAYDEQHRAKRWASDPNVDFPLIARNMTRQDCINKIREIGWPVPEKSGCFFCPFANINEFVELKKKDRMRYNELCEMEKAVLKKFKNMRIKGWYNDNYPLDEMLARKRPASCDGQQCLYCFDGE